MLPKKRRVDTARFKDIMQRSATFHSVYLSLRIQKDTAQVSRFSVVASKKVTRSAVERNFLKRKLSTPLAHFLPHIPVGFQGIFFIKKGFSELKPQEIKDEIKHLLEKSLNISLL